MNRDGSDGEEAVIATAHKIARTVYHLLKYHVSFEEIGATGYDLKQRERDLAYLRKKAAQFGFMLTETPSQVTSDTLISQPA